MFLCPTFSAAACNVAMKILSPKLDRLSYRFSRSLYLDYYQGKSIIGSFIIKEF